MKKMLFLVLIAILFSNSIQAQDYVQLEMRGEVISITFGEYTLEFGSACPPLCQFSETIGKIYSVDEANEIYGEVISKQIVPVSDFMKVLNTGKEYIGFNFTDQKKFQYFDFNSAEASLLKQEKNLSQIQYFSTKKIKELLKK